MAVSRRAFLGTSAAGMAALALARDLKAAAPKIRLSSCSGSIGGGFDKAKLCGLDGLEIGCGGAKETLSIATPGAIKSTMEQSKAAGVAVSSLSMDLLNGRPLFSDEQAPVWVEQVIFVSQQRGYGSKRFANRAEFEQCSIGYRGLSLDICKAMSG